MAQEISESLARLKKLTAGRNARLYTEVEAACMSLYLLKDARLAAKLEKSKDVSEQSRIAAADLSAVLFRLEAACASNAEVLEIVANIRKFLL